MYMPPLEIFQRGILDQQNSMSRHLVVEGLEFLPTRLGQMVVIPLFFCTFEKSQRVV